MWLNICIYMYILYTCMPVWKVSSQAGPKLTPGHSFTYHVLSASYIIVVAPTWCHLHPRGERFKNPSDSRREANERFKAMCKSQGAQLKSTLDHGFLMDFGCKRLTKTPCGWIKLDWGLWYSDVKFSGPNWLCSPPIFVLSSLVFTLLLFASLLDSSAFFNLCNLEDFQLNFRR